MFMVSFNLTRIKCTVCSNVAPVFEFSEHVDRLLVDSLYVTVARCIGIQHVWSNNLNFLSAFETCFSMMCLSIIRKTGSTREDCVEDHGCWFVLLPGQCFSQIQDSVRKDCNIFLF